MNKEQIEKELKKLDPKLETTDEAFKIGMILLSALQVGANTKKISSFLKISEAEVKKYEKNLRESKVWVGEKTCCEWFDKKNGGIAFWCDVSVAQGFLKKTSKKHTKGD